MTARPVVVLVIETAGLPPPARRKAGGYSLGLRRRLGIAAALLGDPPTVTLDEPFNGMDPDGIIRMRGFQRPPAPQGRAVPASSHLVSEVRDTADHLVAAGRGRAIDDAVVADLIAAASEGRARPSRPPPIPATCPSLPGPGSE